MISSRLIGVTGLCNKGPGRRGEDAREDSSESESISILIIGVSLRRRADLSGRSLLLWPSSLFRFLGPVVGDSATSACGSSPDSGGELRGTCVRLRLLFKGVDSASGAKSSSSSSLLGRAPPLIVSVSDSGRGLRDVPRILGSLARLLNRPRFKVEPTPGVVPPALLLGLIGGSLRPIKLDWRDLGL